MKRCMTICVTCVTLVLETHTFEFRSYEHELAIRKIFWMKLEVLPDQDISCFIHLRSIKWERWERIAQHGRNL